MYQGLRILETKRMTGLVLQDSLGDQENQPKAVFENSKTR
jgi:hypothetical protein